jgi:hypothetical protein
MLRCDLSGVICIPPGDEILSVAGLIIIGYMGFLSLVCTHPHRVPFNSIDGLFCGFVLHDCMVAIIGL